MTRDVNVNSELGSYTTYVLWPDGTEDVGGTYTGGATPGLYYTANDSRFDLIHSNKVVATRYGGQRYSASPGTLDKIQIVGTARKWQVNKFVYGRHGVRGKIGLYPDYLAGNAGSMPQAADIVERTVSRARARVLTSLVATDVNFGQFLGELSINAKMIANTAIALLQAYRAARKMNWKLVAKTLRVDRYDSEHILKTAADGWFAYSYGWKPMLTDIYNAKSAIDTQLERGILEKVTRSVQASEAIDDPTGSMVGDISVVAKIGVQYGIENSTLAGLNALGLVNPISIAWELLPMSFVVDWFIPIGSYLKQLSAPLGLGFKSGYETTVVTVNASITRQVFQDYEQGDDPVITVESSAFSRTPTLSFPPPSLVGSLDINSNQILTLGALIVQRT